jgi:leucyl/phenylalanyl-tRNA---protein transferase
MFSRVSDASKIALVALVEQLKQWQFGLIDCQMNTPLLASFGAREIPRSQFTALVAELVNYADVPAPWVLREASASSVRTSPA